ncbi:NAD-P-binding protein [Trematosphaeria pertusa]|uniref:NAD-P-binding protein n=1 Tax=Trematosphaeria pertusa TaxID=390896 RepID=A0A6A6J4S4_9PLEO|nr:NAD-P-binding protein [Trematosphaeria pertusa]KAF2257367.1 NAD-P-binding protein [Trematosphaeria pertusa]
MAQPTTNTAWTIPATATAVKHLTKVEKDVPTPGRNQVLVRLTGASLNFRDILVSTHSPNYPGPHKPDLIACSDGAGLVHSTGPSSVWAGKEGTPVVLHPSTWLSGDVRNLRLDQIYGAMANDGTLQKWIVVDDERVIAAPKGLSGVESSSLITAGVTAWAAIRGSLDGRFDGGLDEWKGAWTEKRLEGTWVLTQGTGGVSCFAIQIAAVLGATVIATSSSDSKLDVAKSLGATHVINYAKMPEWDQEVLRLTDGKGVDHVIEVAGAQTLMKSVNSARAGGLISLIGILSEAETLPAALVPSLLFGGKIIKGCVAFNRDMTAEFVNFVEKNGIKPVVAETFAFDEAVGAFEALQKQSAVGKIAVKISDE